jgi:DNA-binding NarL/FixJ family response regulator
MKSLSKREMEVLSGIVRGERNSAIASRLKLSRKSISTYRSRIFEKLKVDSNAQLVALMARS